MESSRRTFLKRVLASAATYRVFTTAAGAQIAQSDPLPSWNDGPAKQAIIKLAQETTDNSCPDFVPPEERIAEFDQDGTLWAKHPVYTQVVYCLDRVGVLAKEKPELEGPGTLQGCTFRRSGGHREALDKVCGIPPEQGWVIISMKNDWKRIFAFEQ
jgi:hypothetical protein